MALLSLQMTLHRTLKVPLYKITAKTKQELFSWSSRPTVEIFRIFRCHSYTATVSTVKILIFRADRSIQIEGFYWLVVLGLAAL